MINPAHWHLMLNHIPVIGSAFALGLLGWAILRRSEELKRAGLGAVALVAVLTAPAYFTGEPAFEAVMEILEATSEDEDPLVETHEDAAGIAFTSAALAGAVALTGLILGRGGKPLSGRIVVAVFVLTAVTAGLMGRAANLGGVIRHTEIRGVTVPAEGREDKEH